MLSYNHSALFAGFAFPAILCSLLLIGAGALVAAFVGRRFSPTISRWPTIFFRISFECSSILFVISVVYSLMGVFAGFFLGTVDVLSIGFWMLSSAAIAYTARRQHEPTKSQAEQDSGGNGG